MNREFAFYCPELDCIVIQVIIHDRRIGFEFDWEYLAQAYQDTMDHGVDDVLEIYSLMPLGEV